MSQITTHVLDTARGRPADGVPVRLEIAAGSAWTEVARGETNRDGRIPDFMAKGTLEAATYRITFDTGTYFRAKAVSGFYPKVEVVFTITAPNEHHHVPLLLSPFGYSTYRGS